MVVRTRTRAVVTLFSDDDAAMKHERAIATAANARKHRVVRLHRTDMFADNDTETLESKPVKG